MGNAPGGSVWPQCERGGDRARLCLAHGQRRRDRLWHRTRGGPGSLWDVAALGLDEVLFVRRGQWHHREFTTQLVDVERSQLLDIVEGRGADEPKRWITGRSEQWRHNVRFGTLDLSSTYRSVFASALAHATLIADPFHLVRLANDKVDEARRRVQNEVFGHRGRKDDPLYRGRRLLLKAHERLDDKGEAKLLGLLRAGDPRGDGTAAWHAKEAVRQLYAHSDVELATEWIDELIRDMADATWPVEVRSLGGTLARWRDEILAWHRAHFTNGPTEAMNNLIKRVKRTTFGFTSFRNYRVRSLLYAGNPTGRCSRRSLPAEIRRPSFPRSLALPIQS